MGLNGWFGIGKKSRILSAEGHMRGLWATSCFQDFSSIVKLPVIDKMENPSFYVDGTNILTPEKLIRNYSA